MFISFLFATGLDVHWYDKICGCALIVQSRSPPLHRSVVESVLIEATQPTLGTYLIEFVSSCHQQLWHVARNYRFRVVVWLSIVAQHKSHGGSRGCYLSLRFVVWSCLFKILLWLHTLCFQFCTTSIFALRQFLEVGLLAVLTDVLCIRRQALQASVLVLETVRNKWSSSWTLTFVSLHLSAIHVVPSFAHFLVFLGLMLSFVFFATVVASVLLMWLCTL